MLACWALWLTDRCGPQTLTSAWSSPLATQWKAAAPSWCLWTYLQSQVRADCALQLLTAATSPRRALQVVLPHNQQVKCACICLAQLRYAMASAPLRTCAKSERRHAGYAFKTVLHHLATPDDEIIVVSYQSQHRTTPSDVPGQEEANQAHIITEQDMAQYKQARLCALHSSSWCCQFWVCCLLSNVKRCARVVSALSHICWPAANTLSS